MFEISYSLGRKCSVCGSPISDDNPDGIGCTCREVWEKARNIAFYHFCGLDVWIAKSNYWAKLYVETCKNTKFRSSFRKGFFATIKKMVDEDSVRLSKKMLSIITDYLVGDALDLQFGTAFPKFDYEETTKALDGEKRVIRTIRDKWLNDASNEQWEYINNLAKKFYGESARKSA